MYASPYSPPYLGKRDKDKGNGKVRVECFAIAATPFG